MNKYPVRSRVVLKAINYDDEGMTPFDAFHAATADTRGMDVLLSEKDDDAIEVERVALEPSGDE